MSLRAVCVQIGIDPAAERTEWITTSWCNRETKIDKYVFRGATEAVAAVWAMNGVSVCAACAAQMTLLLSNNCEEKK